MSVIYIADGTPEQNKKHVEATREMTPETKKQFGKVLLCMLMFMLILLVVDDDDDDDDDDDVRVFAAKKQSSRNCTANCMPAGTSR